jgi:hypothetical protein
LCDDVLDRSSAGLLMLAIAPVSLVAARTIGLWGASKRTQGEKEFEELQRNEFIIKKLM